MALAPEVTHRDLKHAQARTALQAAHHKLQAGQPIAALQDLLTISRELGGQEAQTPLIQRVLDAFQRGQAPAVDDLTALLAQCSLQIDGGAPSQVQEGPAGSSEEPSILAESGREGITNAALSDGSSYVCARCGGVEEFRELRLRLQGLAEEEQRAAQEQHAVGQPAEERRARQEKLAAASQKLHSLVDALSMWESYE